MIDVQSLDFRKLVRTRKVNGERTIQIDVFPTENNKHYFDLVVEEGSINVLGESYIIKKLNEQSIGTTYWKQAIGVHKFYVDLINKQQPHIHNGSITFNNYMNLVFEDTLYSNFEIVDQFNARSFENLGNDNRLALLQKGLSRYQAELELIGSNYKPRFKKTIGNDTDFQFRYGHNIKSISRNIDTTNLATRIRGTGANGIEAEYTSPNAAIFGIIDAPPVNDERFTTKESLLNEMKSRLQDEPLISIEIDFVDLRRAGYPYTVPNEGDRVFVIYEPMDNLLIETRILEIEEEFNNNMEVIKTIVTLSNHKKTFAGTMFENVQKQLSNIVDDDGVIKYSVLDEAVKIATEALHRAQTELIFENGIIARDKNNPNRVVIFNSEGIGISDDGGNTFREAITSDGFVLSAGAIGRLDANHIQIGPETEFEPNYDPSIKETPKGAQNKADSAEQNAKDYAKNYTDDIDDDLRQDLRLTAPLPTSITMNNNGIRASAQGTNRYAQLDYRGLFVKGGAIQIERPDGAIWMQDGMITSDYNISGFDPHFMDMGQIPGAGTSGRYPAFYFMNGFYQQDYGALDGRGTPSAPAEDIRDHDLGYTVRFQRYEFVHTARYFVLDFRGAFNVNTAQIRVRLQAGSQMLLQEDLPQSAGLVPLVVDLGVPTYQKREIDLRIGWLRNGGVWGNAESRAIFRINRVYQTDHI